ncbi:MAG TPA: hypothetical protein VFH08_05040 [Chitinophagaceae bacterium]|nr:hypothetical protein [Chitinophagaceae bacterium]
MEVHQHTHTPTSREKKWAHYFWEFFMLFFAVFCGFLAEYQLEHKIEKDREQQYIQSILEDLREDTLVLSDNINQFNEHVKRNDTLIRLLNSPDIKDHGSDLYYLGRRASRSVRLAIHDATIQQLKNSGGFRLIRNQKVSKAIIEYYNRLVFIDYLQAITFNEADEYRKMAIDVFHPVLFNDIVTADNTITRPPGHPALLTYEPKILVRLSGMVSYLRNSKLGLAKAEVEMRTAAKELIRLIKQEYKIKY